MSIKIVKTVQLVGEATEEGTGFTAGEAMDQIHRAFQHTMRTVRHKGGVTTGPAKIKVLIEQEVILNGD